MTNNFEHKGVKIGFDASGKFVATVNGLEVRKPSLDAMKKHIDNAAKVVFSPFTAIVDIRTGEKPIKGVPDYTRVEVVGVIKATTRYGSKFAFVTKRSHATLGSHTSEEYRTLYEDTPHNLAALLNEEAKKEEKRKAVEKFDAEIAAIQKTQKRFDPDKFKGKP